MLMQKSRFTRSLLIVVVSLFIFCSCSVNPNKTGAANSLRKNQSRPYFTKVNGGGADTFTIMIYMNGGAAEEDYGLATQVLDAMRQANLSDKVTVVIETGGVENWKNDFLSPNASNRILLTDKNFSLLTGTKLISEMDDGAKLSTFINATKQEFPADRYGLVFWGEPLFDAYQLNQALAGQSLDFVGFDLPMQTDFETAYFLEPCADYLITQAGRFAAGWDYEALLNQLSENTSIATTDIAKSISAAIKNKDIYTMTGTSPEVYCADLTEAKYVANTIGTAYNALAQLVMQGSFEEVSTWRKASAYNEHSVYINQLAKSAKFDAALQMQTAVSNMLCYKETDTQSLTAYFPTADFAQTAQSLGVYEDAGLPYTTFVSTYMSVCLGMQQYLQAKKTDSSTLPSPSVSASPANTSSQTSPDSSASTAEAQSSAPLASTPGTSSPYTWFLPDVAAIYQNTYQKYAAQTANITLQAQESRLSLANDAQAFTAFGEASLEVYLQTEGQNLLLGASSFSYENGLYQKPFTDEWLNINSQTSAYKSMAEDEQGHLLVPALKNSLPIDLLVGQNAQEGTYVVQGSLLNQSPYAAFVDFEKGDVIEFSFEYYDQNLNYSKEATHGTVLPFADKLTAVNAYITGGDIYVRYILHDIFGLRYEGPLLDARLLLMQDVPGETTPPQA